MPDLRTLDLFLDVVRLRSVSQAAAAHGISQPSASKRIRSLERQVGMVLIERRPSGSTPTTDGALVVEWAEVVVQAAREFAASVDALRAGSASVLRVASSYTIAEFLLPIWLQQFRTDHPTDGVSLDVMNSAAVIERVLSGAADLGFVETPVVPRGVGSRVVATDELVTVVAAGHPWTRRPSVPIEAVAGTPLVMREPGSGTRDTLERAMADAGFGTPLVAMEMGSTAAVRAAVLQGMSPAVISSLATADAVAAGALEHVDVDGLVIRRPLMAIWPARQQVSGPAADLLDQLPEVRSPAS